MLLEELLGVLPALAQALVAVGKPRPALLDHVVLNTYVKQATLPRDPLAVHHVKLHRLELCSHLVFPDLPPRLVAYRIGANLKRPYAPDVQPHAGVELKRPPARRRLRRAEHHPDLFPELVDEDGRRARTVKRSRKLPESLAHQPSLKSHMRVAHLTFDLSPRHQCGHRVDHDHVEGAASDEGVGYLQCLLRSEEHTSELQSLTNLVCRL